ncbi:MAG: protein GumC, partial [Deltaproteobacteria bacterium]|nr:protein GumC [Deltaproteobacteria bacterium]
MENKASTIDPNYIIGIILKRRWLVILPFCLAMLAGIALVIVLPKIYNASTMILIQPQKVPDEYVRSIVSADIDSRINTISQQILSRSNLERIIDEFNIFSGPEHDKVFMEDKLVSMRNRISIDLIRENSWGPADAFSISFKGQDPEQVMRVTNALARYFINENLKVREEQALGTSNFLEDELDDIRIQLEQQEEALKNYRARFMGGLPEQLDTNLRILEGLQLQLNMKNESLRYAKNSLILTEKQIEATSQSDAAAAQGQTGLLPALKTEDALEL